MLNVTKDNYNEVIKESAVMEFWTEWCEPSKYILELLSNLDINYYRVNADTEPDLMERLRIVGLPALVYFIGGKIVGFRGSCDYFTDDIMGKLILSDIEHINLARRNPDNG